MVYSPTPVADGGDRQREVEPVLGEALPAGETRGRRGERHPGVLHTGQVPGPCVDPPTHRGGPRGSEQTTARLRRQQQPHEDNTAASPRGRRTFFRDSIFSIVMMSSSSLYNYTLQVSYEDPNEPNPKLKTC